MLKLAVFDLDGTLKVEPDPYVYLHRRLGVMAEAEAITAAGLSGQLAYEDWLRADAELWRGTSRSTLQQFFREDAYIPGAPEAVRALQAHGAEVAILSSGLRLHADMVATDLGITHVFGNEIFFDGGDAPAVTGKVKAMAPIDAKGDLLAQLQAELGVWPDETLAVGDSRSDLPLFARAAVRVAVAPHQPDVIAAADIVLPDLCDLLPRLRAFIPRWFFSTD
jgi:phosphoserine phosphatase